MRLMLALLAIPLAILIALFIVLSPQIGTERAAGSALGVVGSVVSPATSTGADQASAGAAFAPQSSSSTGVKMQDPANPSAETTPILTKVITVVGQGEAKVAPDIAYVNVGVRTREKTAKDAQDKNNQAMAAVIDSIKKLGVPETEIQTNGISLWPVYQQENIVGGYEAANGVTVRVEIAKVGPLLDAAVEAGANSNVSVGFALKDPKAATAQALENATIDARGRADAIAKGLGFTVKEVQIAVEETSTPPVVMRDAGYSLAAAEAKIAPTPVQPGELTVTSRVRVTYSY
jgi:uncharacterized protein YggE